MNHDDFEQDEDFKSKSQLKREMHALQDLGKALTELSEEQLNRLPLEPRLHAALLEMRRLRHREARRRQMQFIGRLMREADQPALEAAMEQFNQNSRVQVQRQQQAEQWRDRLLQEPDALQAFIDDHPATDIQHLRQLLRQTQKEQQAQKPASAQRKLLRYLRELMA